MSKRKQHIEYIITGALIAAAYVGLTFLSNIFSIAYGPVQLRVSEVLTLLPLFTPAAIPGLTVGCFIANIASFNALDMIFGTFATFVAAALTYLLRKIKFGSLPLLSFFSPIIVNSVVIGLEISLLMGNGGFSVWGYLASALGVGIGELITVFAAGIPFYYLVKKYNIFR